MMNIKKVLQTAVEYYQAGKLSEAEHIFRGILRKDQKNAEAYYHLGRILQSRGQLDEAIACYKKVTELNPDFAGAYFNMGNIFQVQGRLDEAIACYQKAIDLNPDVAVAYNNLGNILQEKAQFDEAISYYQKAIQLDPHLHMAYENLARAYYGLGYLYREKGQRDRAIDYYLNSLRMNPNGPDIYYNLGILYQEKGELDEALTCYQEIIKRDPLHANALNAIGSILQKKGEIDEAMEYYRKALQIDPHSPEALNNLGTILNEKGQPDGAEKYYQKALQGNPAFSAALNNLGTIFRDKGQLNEAEMYYRKALALNPDFAEAHWNMAFTYLLAGNYREGWKEYEWRWKIQDHYLHNLTEPLWDGSDIRGRTILIHAEQGFGDTIQFIRYAPLVAKMGARVIVACQKELSRLLQTVESIEQVVAYGNVIPKFDLHCPLLRLPLLFNTTLENIPTQIPYLTANNVLVREWCNRLQNNFSTLKIGLVWSGGGWPLKKSISIDMFSPLGQLDAVTFYSLQKGPAAEHAKNPPKGIKLIDYTDMLYDFSDTAALIENLDLIVSVDTSVAHLAGALGKPVWTLLLYSPDWRWLLNREDSPWYPTMRLFRQPSPGDWHAVVKHIYESLKEMKLKPH